MLQPSGGGRRRPRRPASSTSWRTTTCWGVGRTAGPGPIGRVPRAPYTSEHTFHEIITLFSHLAAATTTIEFVTSVLGAAPAPDRTQAKQLSTLDLLSGGRLRVAVGVGWNRAEYEGLGVDYDEATRRFEEQIDVLRLLWASQSSA